jgi:hypothetical protein
MVPPSSPIIAGRPTLKWLDKASLILANGFGVRGPTYVFLEGTRYPLETELPGRFDMLKAHSSIVRQFRTNVLHRPEFSPSDNVDVDPTGPGAVRSRPYKLGRKRRLAPPVRLLFQDGTNKRSPELRVTGPVEVESVETGAFSIGPIARLSLKIEAARLHQEVESLVFYAASPGVSSVTVYPSCSRRRTDCRATMVRSRSSK